MSGKRDPRPRARRPPLWLKAPDLRSEASPVRRVCTPHGRGGSDRALTAGRWFPAFLVVSLALLPLLPRIAPWFFRRYGDRVIEPEIKLVFVSLLVLSATRSDATRRSRPRNTSSLMDHVRERLANVADVLRLPTASRPRFETVAKHVGAARQ